MMKEEDFVTAAELVHAGLSINEIERQRGKTMSRIVSRMRRLPAWEAMRPTPDLAKKVWRELNQDLIRQGKASRARKRQQRRLIAL
jgi:hypothetical protein